MEIGGLGTFYVCGIRLADRLLVDRRGSIGAGGEVDEPVARHVHRLAGFDIFIYEAIERFCASIAFYHCRYGTRSVSVTAALGIDLRYLADARYLDRAHFVAAL